jgi:hypothetical protein
MILASRRVMMPRKTRKGRVLFFIDQARFRNLDRNRVSIGTQKSSTYAIFIVLRTVFYNFHVSRYINRIIFKSYIIKCWLRCFAEAQGFCNLPAERGRPKLPRHRWCLYALAYVFLNRNWFASPVLCVELHCRFKDSPLALSPNSVNSRNVTGSEERLPSTKSILRLLLFLILER